MGVTESFIHYSIITLFISDCRVAYSASISELHIIDRVVIKISSCRVNTTSRRGIKRLGIPFGSIFLLFSNKSSRGATLLVAGENPRPPALNDNPDRKKTTTKQNKTKNEMRSTTLNKINVVYDIAFKSRKRFQHSDVISQVFPGMRSKVSK